MERHENAKNSEIHLVAHRRISKLRISQFESQFSNKNISVCEQDVFFQVFDHSEHVNSANGIFQNNNKLELENADIEAQVNRLCQKIRNYFSEKKTFFRVV